MKKRAILSRKRSSKEELLFNMENVPSVSKSAINNEKISYKERTQVPSKAEKMPSKEELLFKMEKVPYVSNKCN